MSLPAGISLRPATEADYDFMRRLYVLTHRADVERFPFDEMRKVAFLEAQFAARTSDDSIRYPACEQNIIESDGRPIGRLLIDEWKDQFRLVDIALLPEWRGAGIGTALLRRVLARAVSVDKPVTVLLGRSNPALPLFQRLGFEYAGIPGVEDLMQWRPQF